MGESAIKSSGKGERGAGSGSAAIVFLEQFGDFTFPDGGVFAKHNPTKKCYGKAWLATSQCYRRGDAQG
jgi:hypothetical protein